jgi:DNA transposition AAA+ family ATPase
MKREIWLKMNDETDIQKGLEKDARLVTERMPMDSSQLNARQKAASLREFMEARKYSQGDVAGMLDVSVTMINHFLAGKYKGDLETLINKVVNLINSVTRRERRIKNKPYIETTVAKRIAELITHTVTFSDEEAKIGLVVGDGGHGKSVCLKQYAEANKNTVYIEMHAAMTSRSLFAELAKKVGIDSSGNLDSIAERLIGNLQNREVVMMIDEASGLTVKQLNQLRTVIVVKSHCPLILSGNNHLLTTVMQPTVRRGFESLDQFTSRLMYILDLDAMAADKDGGLYTVEDVRKLYEYGGVRLAGDAIKALRKICMSPRSGRLRTCSHIISAILTARLVGKGGQIEARHIIGAIEKLRLPVRVWLPIRGADQQDEDENTAEIKAG